jgi:plasmid maintenance system killer protein
MESRTTRAFWEQLKSLSPEVQKAAAAAYEKFIRDRAHPSLHLERLRSDPRTWSVRVNRDVRAVALRVQRQTAENEGEQSSTRESWLWFWIGDHKDFDKKFPT